MAGPDPDIKLQAVISTVSHDLRGPLHAISLALEALRDEVGAGGQRYLASIERAAQRAERLIADLVEAHRVETGQLELEVGAIDAGAVIRQVIAEHADAAREAGTAITAVLPPAPVLVQADRDRVLQVLAALLANALRHAQRAPIEIELQRTEPDAIFIVRDGGPGFDAVELPHVFDRYWPERKQRGATGLGLAIAAGLVAAHGGRIEAANLGGPAGERAGAALTFTLPLAAARPG